jgi:hypothetical protein
MTARGRHGAAHRAAARGNQSTVPSQRPEEEWADGPERELWLSWPSVAAVREPPIVPRPVIAAAVLLGCVIVAGAVLVLASTARLPAAAPRTARLPAAPAASWQPGRYRPPVPPGGAAARERR